MSFLECLYFSLSSILEFLSLFLLKINIMQDWKTVKEYEDITYKKCNGVARIAFNRPEVRNAFRPKTTSERINNFVDNIYIVF